MESSLARMISGGRLWPKTMESAPRNSCLKLQIPNQSEPIFIKATWFASHFHLSITDGLNAWFCNGISTKSLTASFLLLISAPILSIDSYFRKFAASEDELRQRAAQWDQPVSDYIALAERFLGFQQPGSVYGFSDAGDGHKRVRWILFYFFNICISVRSLRKSGKIILSIMEVKTIN